MTAEHVPCIEVVELLSDYIEGALDEPTVQRIEAHLELCPPCVLYLEQLRATIRQVAALPAPTLSAAAVAQVEAAFRDLHQPPAV